MKNSTRPNASKKDPLHPKAERANPFNKLKCGATSSDTILSLLYLDQLAGIYRELIKESNRIGSLRHVPQIHMDSGFLVQLSISLNVVQFNVVPIFHLFTKFYPFTCRFWMKGHVLINPSTKKGPLRPKAERANPLRNKNVVPH